MHEGRPAELAVLFLINGLGPGGAERSLAELLPRLPADGIHPLVTVLATQSEGVESDVRLHGVPVRPLRANTFPGRIRELRGLLRAEGVDLVHTSLFESDVIGRLAAAGTGIPVLTSLVNTAYDPVRLRDPNIRPWKLRAVRTIDGWTARHLTTHFHAISAAVKESTVQTMRVPESRITVVLRGRSRDRLGLPSPDRRAAARRAVGIEQDAEVVLNVARQEFQKGQRHLLDAAPRLLERPGLVVLVAGRTGNSTADLRAQHARLGLGDRVRFLGHRDDVPELLAAADLFVFPSLYEGLGGALLEAMAMELPVVASQLPAISEVVADGETGSLVAPGDSAALAAAIEALLDDPDRRRAYGEEGRQRFERLFTAETTARAMIELIRRVATKHRSRSLRVPVLP